MVPDMIEEEKEEEPLHHFLDRSESDYVYGRPMSEECCAICGRTGTLLIPYGEDLACVYCLAMENGEESDEVCP